MFKKGKVPCFYKPESILPLTMYPNKPLSQTHPNYLLVTTAYLHAYDKLAD
ncbi:hypothetical protein [Paenibacillus turicensis]|uniref:hypothetical protein n=1 Tax=Paenibacillus turicensis TaxID=160487 RepID=UPI001AE946BD|nr:hypothetical protein [Paenibacillus turicensis]